MVSNPHNHCVHIVTRAGRDDGHLITDIDPPRHITGGTDIMVSNPHNHCVHIVTRAGRHDGHLITNIDPTCVCLDVAVWLIKG